MNAVLPKLEDTDEYRDAQSALRHLQRCRFEAYVENAPKVKDLWRACKKSLGDSKAIDMISNLFHEAARAGYEFGRWELAEEHHSIVGELMERNLLMADLLSLASPGNLDHLMGVTDPASCLTSLFKNIDHHGARSAEIIDSLYKSCEAIRGEGAAHE